MSLLYGPQNHSASSLKSYGSGDYVRPPPPLFTGDRRHTPMIWEEATKYEDVVATNNMGGRLHGDEVYNMRTPDVGRGPIQRFDPWYGR